MGDRRAGGPARRVSVGADAATASAASDRRRQYRGCGPARRDLAGAWHSDSGLHGRLIAMEPRKRSNIVLLTLVGLPLGAVALGSAIPAGQEVRRNLYPDRGACERDYSPTQCEARP